MKFRHWMMLGAASFGTVSLGMAVKSFLPQHFLLERRHEEQESAFDPSTLPAIEVDFLRCGIATWPVCIMERGAFSLAPRRVAYSGVVIRHPEATFLYDTGLCNDISLFLRDQSVFFRNTLARFTFERSLASHLQRLGLRSEDLNFALLSHLHWDHVAGVPDIPGVLLRVNRVEHTAACDELLEKNRGLVRRLLNENPLELFDCDGPPYEGFRASLDLLGDGSIILVPLPGHTAGNTGMFINRSNGTRLFLLGDAAYSVENYARPATAHPIFWSRVTSDDATARQTLIDLHRFSRQHPEIPLIAMHDVRLQESFMAVEQRRAASVK